MKHPLPLCLREWVEEFHRLVSECPLMYSSVCNLLQVCAVTDCNG